MLIDKRPAAPMVVGRFLSFPEPQYISAAKRLEAIR
jgi:hypothetical protein